MSRKTTVKHYLAPVRHLQLESLLAESAAPLDDLFAKMARAVGGIQDIVAVLTPVGEWS
ncbi:hypothetical protein [Streptomyces omiyaensis]|uniref:hypothetical protein n=1 Tax=Streptomyces omiyaensis TaxID=68247 RepID=UPI0037017575